MVSRGSLWCTRYRHSFLVLRDSRSLPLNGEFSGSKINFCLIKDTPILNLVLCSELSLPNRSSGGSPRASRRRLKMDSHSSRSFRGGE